MAVGGLAVVCGAAGGLGPAVLRDLDAAGWRLVAVASHRRPLVSLAAIHAGAHWEQADLTDPDDVAALWGRIDERGETPTALVNLTGGFVAGGVTDAGRADLNRMLAVNLEAPWWACREAARRMAASGGGAIVNVGSRAGLSGTPAASAYAVSKAALHRLTEVLAAELRPAGIRVNAVVPTTIDTAANRAWMSPGQRAAAVPPELIAAAVRFLCDGASAGVTGALIPVPGL